MAFLTDVNICAGPRTSLPRKPALLWAPAPTNATPRTPEFSWPIVSMSCPGWGSSARHRALCLSVMAGRSWGTKPTPAATDAPTPHQA